MAVQRGDGWCKSLASSREGGFRALPLKLKW